MGSLVHHPALVEQHHPVSEPDGGFSVRDHDHGATFDHLPHRAQDLAFHADVHRRGGVVQHQQVRFGQQCARQRDPLPLPAGQAEALLADLGVVALGQPGDEVVDRRDPADPLQLLVGGVGFPVREVVAQPAGQQHRFVEDHADPVPQVTDRQVADVHAIQPDRTGSHVPQPWDQLQRAGLAGPGGPDHRHGLARQHLQVEAAQPGCAGRIVEPDVLEPQVCTGMSRADGRRRRFRFGDARFHRDDLRDPFGTGPCTRQQSEDTGQHPGRAVQIGQVRQERHERPDRGVPVQHQQATDQQHQHLTGERRSLQGGQQRGPFPYRAHPGGEHHGQGLDEAVQFGLLLPETLHHPDAGNRLLGDLGHVGLPLLGVPGSRVHPHVQAFGHHHQQHENQQQQPGQDR